MNPPNKDAPEFKRHVLGWFEEASEHLVKERMITINSIGEQVQLEVQRYFTFQLPNGNRSLHTGELQ